jgi:hypothetical protein
LLFLRAQKIILLKIRKIMANLKLDLLNKLRNDKYYEELELVRLAQDPNTNYKEKIDAMSFRLSNLAMVNAQMGLVEQYFQEPAQQPPMQVPAPDGVPVQQQPQGKVHQGQTHGE